MNFLAHAYLAEHAGPDDALIAGGVMGDWVKGPLAGQSWPADLLHGVALHRAIDAFADRNDAFLRSRARVSALRRRWSGVLIDMFYDHLLAAQWGAWHPQTLTAFTQKTYAALDKHLARLPAETQDTLAPPMLLMRSEDWLGSYAHLDGLSAILARMGRRARQPNPLPEGAEEFLAAQAGFTADFAEFLPAAQNFAAAWISSEISPAPQNVASA